MPACPHKRELAMSDTSTGNRELAKGVKGMLENKGLGRHKIWPLDEKRKKEKELHHALNSELSTHFYMIILMRINMKRLIYLNSNHLRINLSE